MSTPAGVQKAWQVRLVKSEEENDLHRILQKAQEYLLRIQRPDGHWCGELEGDTILESEYILTMLFIGRLGDHRVLKAAEFVRRCQLPGGGVGHIFWWSSRSQSVRKSLFCPQTGRRFS